MTTFRLKARICCIVLALTNSAYATESKKDCGPVPPGGMLDENCKFVPVPPPHLREKAKPETQSLRLKKTNGFESIPSDRVLTANLRLFPEPQDIGKKTKEINFEGAKLKTLLSKIEFNSPEEPGAPASMVTGELVLFIKSDVVRAIEDRKFTIHNGRLLNDSQASTVYYRIKKTLRYSDY